MQHSVAFVGLCFLYSVAVNIAVFAQETVKDIDGNEYRTVTIGDQVWMKDNLKVSHNPAGDNVPAVCYENLPENCTLYGKLYTWNEIMDGSKNGCAQGLCPDGWHVPSDNEWKVLEMALGMSREEAERGDDYPWRGTDQGIQLSVAGASGFNFLDAGRRNGDGSFSSKDEVAYFWTSTQANDTSFAWRRCLATNNPGVGRWSTFPKTYAFSVRCLKDEVLTVEKVISKLAATYDKIDTYEADAEIVKLNPCNVKRSNGFYHYNKPESAFVKIDTSIYTSLDLRGCESVLEGFSIIVAPILSTEPLKRMLQLAVTIQDSVKDTIKLSFTVDSTVYEYFIDRYSWLITSIKQKNRSFTSFHADYHYSYQSGIPVLRLVAMQSDTTLTHGGYRFSNIKINGSFSVRKVSADKNFKAFCFAYLSSGKLIVTFYNKTKKTGMYRIRDLAGRTVFKKEIAQNVSTIEWDGFSNSKQHVHQGVYILQIEYSGKHFSKQFIFF